MNVISVVFVSVFFGGLFVMIIVTTLVKSIKDFSKHKLDNELKLKLIERGLSVADIERLININPREFDDDDDDDDYDDDSHYNRPRPPIKNY